MVGQPGDQANDKFVVVLDKPQLLLEPALVLLLFLQHVGDAVIGVQHAVGIRIPNVVVDTVDDAPQLAGMIPQMGVQPLAVVPALNLARVGLAHRGDDVRVGQAALQHIGVPVARLQRVLVEHIIRQPGPVADRGNIINPLEPQVVDGQDGLGGGQLRVDELGPQVHRDQGGLPVVTVDNIGGPIHKVQRRQGRFGEITVLRNIVHKIGIRISVAEELLVVDEIIHHAVPDVLHDTHIEGAAVRAEVHFKSAPVHHLLLILPGNTLVPGENDLHVAVLFHQGLGKGVHNVAQAAGFDEGIAL